MVYTTEKLFLNLPSNIFCIDKNVVHFFIVYELDTRSTDLNTGFALGRYLFVAEKLTKNANSDKYKHSGYGIRFDALSQFSI